MADEDGVNEVTQGECAEWDDRPELGAVTRVSRGVVL